MHVLSGFLVPLLWYKRGTMEAAGVAAVVVLVAVDTSCRPSDFARALKPLSCDPEADVSG